MFHLGDMGHSFFFCASLKQMWNVLNAFPRPHHSWEERQVPAHPIQAVTREGNDSPRPALWSHHLPRRTVGSQLQLDQRQTHGWRAHLPLPGFLVLRTYFLSAASPCRVVKGQFCPLFLQPGALACFLSRNLKVGF